MGIKDLLRFMKPFIVPVHIKKYAGKRVGIDAYSWLHKGAYSCSMEICLNSNSEKKSRYIDYFMHRINLLRYHKITPVVVFDGANIPCKAATENERYRRRKDNRELAMVKLKEGDVRGASELFQRAVSITPAMAHQLIHILRSENIEFVVAPYEADAQLAYLATLEAEKGGVVAVITEDSDLIAYGCPAITFKMDRYGNGEELVLAKVFDSITSKPSFRGFDKELFIGMCVLAGCDFLPSVPGIGIAKAHSLVSKYRNLDRVLSVLKIEKGSQKPEDYSKSFKEAVAVFQHARIYDGEIKGLKHMKPLTQQLLQILDEGLDFLGPEISPSVAIAIAEGNLDPTTMEAFDSMPTPGNHPVPTEFQASGKLQLLETADISRQESCFLVFSSHKTRERNKTGTMRQGAVSIEKKYIQDAGLERLAFPLKSQATKENVVAEDIPLIPNNNPFKKRKLDEMHIAEAKDTTDLVSSNGQDEIERSEILCVFPDNTQLAFPGRKVEMSSNQIESTAEQISMVSKVESCETLHMTVGSQESVSCDPKRLFSGRGRGKNDKLKLKGSNCKNSETKNSILNFFARV
ncbi:exonuclease 1 [Herrania umbratica]|uniref:Exonuclease 1 n=1 Tax=Herrania umbratica TaxID=108875 RepID=A0A6J1AZ71_9ROSI|nr:exonuclease 1 [Herrania umbratica]